MEKVILSASGIRRQFREKEVLRGVDLTLSEGSMTAITGTSGAGKSTLLAILGGLDRQSAGTLRFRGKELQKRDLRAFRRKEVGFVFQDSCLIEELTALDNIRAAVRISGSGTDAGAYLAMVGLAEYAAAYPVQLSGGQGRRIALARALAKKPSLLLLDEPTEGLDDVTGGNMLALTEQLCREAHITLVMVTHHLYFARRMERILRLENGVLCPEVDE